jgi:serine/threonine protein kinase
MDGQQEYTLLRNIGDGVYSSVFSARARNGGLVAIKMVSRGAFRKRGGRHAENEIRALSLLRDRAIPEYISHYETEEYSCIVMELIEGLSAGEMVFKKKLPGAMGTLLSISRQVIEAIAYIHSEGVYHLDIKPENVMIGPGGTVKLIDFGCSVLCKEGKVSADSLQFDGTPAYMAPEMIHRPKESALLLAPMDVWGFGCFMYYIFTGKQAFEAPSLYSLYPKVLRAEIDSGKVPSEVREIVRGIFMKAQEDRSTTERILSIIKKLQDRQTCMCMN